MDVLRQVLAKYPATDLGEWTWVLVRPEDWRRILLDRGFSPDSSPAFSILSHRETFLEGALVTKVSFRGVQLSKLWRMPIEDLLDLAIRHELGHALCNERDETRANRAAIALKNGGALSCQATLLAKATETPIKRGPSGDHPNGQRSSPRTRLPRVLSSAPSIHQHHKLGDPSPSPPLTTSPEQPVARSLRGPSTFDLQLLTSDSARRLYSSSLVLT